jgi:Cdc6-like AAA superfamily ATPase
MEKGAMSFWNLERDPFSMSPLNPHQSFDRSILVSTKTIKKIRSEYEAIADSKTSLSYIISGGRGTGKSTAMYDLYYRFSQEITKTHNLPLICNVYADQDFVESTENIIQDIHVSLLLSLDRLLQSRLYPYKHHYEEVKGIIESAFLNTDKRNFVDRAIHRIYEMLMDSFNRIVIFIDNLDKIHPQDYFRISESLSRDQTFIEFLMKGEILPEGKSCIFVFTINNYISSLISREISYLGDTNIEIEPWTFEEMKELINKRLQSASKDRPYNLLNYFEKDALRETFITNDFNPRYCQNACRKLMEESYKISVDTEGRELHKPIKKHFCCSRPTVMDGTKGFAPSTKFEILDVRLRKQHKGAYVDIQKCLSESKDKAPELVKILIDVFKGRDDEDLEEALEVFIEKGLVRVRKRGTRKSFLLDPKINNLVEYVDDLLDGNIEVMQHFLFSLII